jgi:hypothetical protein
VSAQRSGSGTASKKDGIGVPFKPVLKVRKMSSRRGPPRNVQRRVRSAARIAWLRSSLSVGAEGPSPRPASPWQRTQPSEL